MRLYYDVNLGAAYDVLMALYRDFDGRQDWGSRTVGEVTANPTHVLGNAAGHLFDQQLPGMRESIRWPSLEPQAWKES